ncbi:MAG: FAD-binding oxidoreductase [Candidatus Dormibacteraeota bacterium]|nr:FAD-binding oxidoreductase [Candidatus Dormibacteraeota bacterium]
MNSLDVHLLAGPFANAFTGTVIMPGDPAYDAARAVWNGTVDARPALIAQCRTTDDIVAAVDLVRTSRCTFSVRGGGHSVAGLSMCDDGVVIDLSHMRGVTVDVQTRTATVEPGATWADFDAATAAHGLASTGGLISSTGVAGLTLGGGIGWLQRKYGLACDNLVSADVVTADGEVIRVSEADHSGLLWGLRGGGGNFGVVARFQFALHPVSTVLAGLMLFPLDRGKPVLKVFRDWASEAPDEATMLAAIMTAPPEPFVPPDLVGRKAVAIVGCWCGDLDAGQSVIEPLRQLGPTVDLFGPMPYPALQGMLDPGAPSGLRNYFRGGYVSNLSDDVIDVAVEHGSRLPSPMSAIHFHQMGGAVGRVAAGATAFSGRDAGYTYNVVSTWVDSGEDATHVSANRALSAKLAPLSEDGAYVNFLPDTDGERVRAAYGDELYTRLARLKREYDSANLFNHNQNVRPAR